MIVNVTYPVGPGSSIRTVHDADHPGVPITAARGPATALPPGRTLQHARLTPTRASGTVKGAIESAGIRGVPVAPGVP